MKNGQEGPYVVDDGMLYLSRQSSEALAGKRRPFDQPVTRKPTVWIDKVIYGGAQCRAGLQVLQRLEFEIKTVHSSAWKAKRVLLIGDEQDVVATRVIDPYVLAAKSWKSGMHPGKQ